MRWFIIDGNIGSGKSTIVNKIKEATGENVKVVPEPVDLWLSIKNSEDNLLSLFYKDPHRYAYTFQTVVFKTRIQSLLSAFQESRTDTVFSERSIWTDKYVFAKACYNNGLMNEVEYKAHELWFNWLEELFVSEKNSTSILKLPKPTAIIYVKCSPEKCFERMKNRNRTEESSVPLDYLRQLHDYHEEWIQNWDYTPTIILDNERDLNDDEWNALIQEKILGLCESEGKKSVSLLDRFLEFSGMNTKSWWVSTEDSDREESDTDSVDHAVESRNDEEVVKDPVVNNETSTQTMVSSP
jgi:deoxycitidine kinase